MLGVCYYPEHWPETFWQRDASRMVELGIRHVRIGEFAWSRLEPRRGDFQFGWLDRALDALHGAGLRIVLGTPTATPPKWLMDAYPDIAPVDEQGRVRGFGSRRHYCFSSEDWLRESRRIVEIIARRYGTHPGLEGWQTDNEYGCHDTTLSYGSEDLKAFRNWLRHRYQSAEQMNEAWGSVFWSMELDSFDQVTLPNLTVTEANPAHRLDFWRFQSDQVAAYNRMQCEIIRAHSPGRWITHNFMGLISDFDHWKVGDDLDVASWDSYPIGFVEKFPFSEEERTRWAETSHPDMAAFHHDLYRGVGKGRLWIMEQQPGPVNWAPWNPVPKPGMVRLWTLEAIAHGAEVVSYFRWRQAPFAQEQMHAGLNLPGLHELSVGGMEARQAAADLQALGPLGTSSQAPVALIYDYETCWSTMIQPQGKDFRSEELAYRWYEAVRRLGVDVDVVRPGGSLEGYKLVLVPGLVQVPDEALAALAETDALVLYGPRTGSRDRHFAIPDNLAPGPLQSLLAMRITQVSSLRPGLEDRVTGKVSGSAIRWREYVTTAARVLGSFRNGDPALVASGRHHYLACWPDEALLTSALQLLAEEAGLALHRVPAHVRLRSRGHLTFAFNYGPESWTCPDDVALVLGERTVKPQDFAVWRS